jgi:hypothetical protein
MVAAVLVFRVHDVNDDLVEVAARVAAARSCQLIFIGVPPIRPWVEGYAPLTGHLSARQIRTHTQAELDDEVRRCVRLVPDTVSARHLGWPDWDTSALAKCLSKLSCIAVVASGADVRARHRRRVRSLASQLGAELVLAPVVSRRSRLAAQAHETLSLLTQTKNVA